MHNQLRTKGAQAQSKHDHLRRPARRLPVPRRAVRSVLRFARAGFGGRSRQRTDGHASHAAAGHHRLDRVEGVAQHGLRHGVRGLLGTGNLVRPLGQHQAAPARQVVQIAVRSRLPHVRQSGGLLNIQHLDALRDVDGDGDYHVRHGLPFAPAPAHDAPAHDTPNPDRPHHVKGSACTKHRRVDAELHVGFQQGFGAALDGSSHDFRLVPCRGRARGGSVQRRLLPPATAGQQVQQVCRLRLLLRARAGRLPRHRKNAGFRCDGHDNDHDGDHDGHDNQHHHCRRSSSSSSGGSSSRPRAHQRQHDNASRRAPERPRRGPRPGAGAGDRSRPSRRGVYSRRSGQTEARHFPGRRVLAHKTTGPLEVRARLSAPRQASPRRGSAPWRIRASPCSHPRARCRSQGRRRRVERTHARSAYTAGWRPV